MPNWITTGQAAELTGYSKVQIRRLLIAGKIKGQRWGRDWQVDRPALLAYVKAVEKLGAKRGPKSGG